MVVTCFVTHGVSRRVSRCGLCVDGKLANAVAVACGAKALPVSAGVPPDAAEALKARLAALSDAASGQGPAMRPG